jgi:excisionase family DNA binding protein
MSERLVYRVDEVAELLGCGKSTVYDAIARDELPGVLRLGRRILVSRVALHAALGLTEAAFGPPEPNGAGSEAGARKDKSHVQSTGSARR